MGNVPRFDDDPSLHLASSGVSEARGMEGYLFQEDSDKISGSILSKVHKGFERLINGFDSGSKRPVLEDHKTQLVSYDLTVLGDPPLWSPLQE